MLVLASSIHSTFFAHQLLFLPFGFGSMVPRAHTSKLNLQRAACPGASNLRVGLTFRSTRTPPALSAALSQLLASSASFSASAQAGPVSFFR